MTVTTTRTYHTTSAAYILPNDAPEHLRLKSQATALDSLMHGRAIQAPLSEPKKLLEIGCGTGLMTRRLLSLHPAAQQVVGVDLSPVPGPTPPRATFLQGDFFELAKKHPLLTKGEFDYVFSRLLVFGMSDWKGYISKAKDMLASGGWLELQEGDQVYRDAAGGELRDNEKGWVKRQEKACSARGLDTRCAGKLAGWMREAGFVDVEVKEFRWVIGKWKGHPEADLIGDYSVKYLTPMFVETYRKVMAGERTEKELDEDEKEVRETFSWSEEGKYTPFVVVCGRKP